MDRTDLALVSILPLANKTGRVLLRPLAGSSAGSLLARLALAEVRCGLLFVGFGFVVQPEVASRPQTMPIEYEPLEHEWELLGYRP